ncbi:MAG: SRPBCC family protein [Actinobacteria bacterium]|nr:SRPBCC family protein [Actinomycetota bacterium]
MSDFAGRTYEIEHTRSASCSADAVMKIITDPATWPEWQSEILETKGPIPLSTGAVVEGRATLLGFIVDGRSSTVTATGSSYVEDVIVGVRMRVRYEVRDTAEGVTVTRRLSASLPGGFSGRALSFLLKRRLKAMQEGVLDALIAQAEEA